MSAARITALASVAAAAIALVTMAAAPTIAQPAGEKTVMVGGAAMYPSKNIVENAMNSKDHTTLEAAVKAAGLVEALQGPGPFTVFAPTNSAFAKVPPGTGGVLGQAGNKAKPTRFLPCHVVSANAVSPAIAKMSAYDKGTHPVKTVGGCVLQAKMM